MEIYNTPAIIPVTTCYFKLYEVYKINKMKSAHVYIDIEYCTDQNKH